MLHSLIASPVQAQGYSEKKGFPLRLVARIDSSALPFATMAVRHQEHETG
jgi:hypothetical protein